MNLNHLLSAPLCAWWRDRGGDMVEGALTLPLMALVALALVNLSLAGYASVTANNAANAAARMASVAQADPVGQGLAAAQQSLQMGIGAFDVSLTAAGNPGGDVTATVQWRVPNFFGPLLGLFHGSDGDAEIRGVAVAQFRKEGW